MNAEKLMKIDFLKVFVLSTLLLAGAAGCKKDTENTPELPKTLTEEVAKRTNLTILGAALAKTGLADTLRANRLFTLLAPNDTAFQAMPLPFNTVAGINGLAATDPKVAELTAILRYHILASAIPVGTLQTGLDANRSLTLRNRTDHVYLSKSTTGLVTVNGARMREANQPASNGLIHVIDRVNLPPAGDVAQLAAGSADLNLLYAALVRTGLETSLKAAGPLTVFAPADDAFLAVLRSLTGNASLDEAAALNFINTQLSAGSTPNLNTITTVLRYHVASGRYYAPALAAANLTALPTLNAGQNVALTAANGTVTVTGAGNGGLAANLKTPDLHATNGVVHAIDRVLLP